MDHCLSFWPLYCLSCFRPITPLVSFGHCIVCPASVRLPIWYLLAIVLSVLLPSDYPLWYLLTTVSSVLLPSDYPFGIFWPLYRLSCFRPITPLVSFDHCIVCPASVRLPLWYLLAIVLSVLLPSNYPFGIFKLF